MWSITFRFCHRSLRDGTVMLWFIHAHARKDFYRLDSVRKRYRICVRQERGEVTIRCQAGDRSAVAVRLMVVLAPLSAHSVLIAFGEEVGE